jgi:hypothetical protein
VTSRPPSLSATATAADLHRLAAAAAAYPDTVTDEALPTVGARLTAIALEQAAAAGAARLSRYGGGRGVTLDATAARNGDTVTLTPRPLGPWTLVESGSHRDFWYTPRAGPERPRHRGVSRIALADGGVRWYARHGPVKGKQVWSKTKDQIDQELPELIHTSALKAWDDVRKAA